jgi:hypothetical protein
VTGETTRRADEILARTLRRVEIFAEAGDDWPFAQPQVNQRGHGPRV